MRSTVYDSSLIIAYSIGKEVVIHNYDTDSKKWRGKEKKKIFFDFFSIFGNLLLMLKSSD